MKAITKKLNYSNGQKQTPFICITHAMGEFIQDDAGRVYSAHEWLNKLGYAPHVTITPSGVVFEHLDFDIMGAHAKGYNLGSIGVEFLVKGVHNYHTFLKAIEIDYLYGDQYVAGVEYYRKHLQNLDHVRHSEIDKRLDAKGQKVKQDPGNGFPWEQFIKDINC